MDAPHHISPPAFHVNGMHTHLPAFSSLLVGPAVAGPHAAVVELGDAVDEGPSALVHGPLSSLLGVPRGHLLASEGVP